MELQDKFKKLLVKKYEELQTYATTYNDIADKQREQLQNEVRQAFMKDPNSVSIEDIARDTFFINGFYQADIRKLQVELLDIYSVFKELIPEEELPIELENTIMVLKANLQKQLFVVKDGKFEEIEKGKVEKLKEDYASKGYFKMLEEQVKKELNA